MKNFGYIRVASAIPATRVADCTFNTDAIIKQVYEAIDKDVDIICFPELCITGYSCQDLFLTEKLLTEADNNMQRLLNQFADKEITIIVGMPYRSGTGLYNCAFVLQKGRIQGKQAKHYLPNYNEFYERRWFCSADCHTQPNDVINNIFEISDADSGVAGKVRFGIELCEDVWSPNPPSTLKAIDGADIIFNLSASNELIGKHQYLCNLLSQQSARTISAYVYSSCGFGESTQDLVFGGNALIYENGELLARSNRFSTNPQMVVADIDVELIRNERLQNSTFREVNNKENHNLSCPINLKINFLDKRNFYRNINPHPFVPADEHDLRQRCEEITNIQSLALAKRIMHVNAKKVVIGVSGGLDSTLSLLVACQAMDKIGRNRADIVGITMPCFGTTSRTHDNALKLMKWLGITSKEINIADAVNQHFTDIGHNPAVHNLTFENCQARERTQVLMDYACKDGGFVLGTGDLSELALGWCTYNADHMSMYNVNASIPKTLVRYLVNYYASITTTDEHQVLIDILETPVSPELLPPTADGKIAQKTEDTVGPYELHDFFLYNFVRRKYSPQKIYWLACQAKFSKPYDRIEIRKWLSVFVRRFFTQQYKRSCMPDGPKVGSVSLSPRGDWRMPTDASYNDFLKESELDEVDKLRPMGNIGMS